MPSLFRWVISIALALPGSAPAADDRLFAATDVTGVPWGRDFQLLGHDGRSHRLAEVRGKGGALYFGYTQCPDVCPTTMATLAQALRVLVQDRALGRRV